MPQKKLAWGYTTGTCAQAATKAAMEMLMTGREIKKTEVVLPSGKKLRLDIHDIYRKYGESGILPISVSCAVKKDSGDDPDITNGVLVYSKVERIEKKEIILEGGKGIGRITKPGLQQPVGEPAINRVPRQMIIKEVKDSCEEVGYGKGIRVEISIPEGEELALRTFNPRLGIEGGLSVLGTSGMVEPMSEQALIDTIRVEMQVKLAEGRKYLVVAPGNYGLEFLKKEYQIQEEDVVKCSNYIGQMLDIAVELGCKGLLLAGHIGKLVKVAGGIMNTHSKWADCRMELLAASALLAGLGGDKACELLACVTTDDALNQCTERERELLIRQLMKKIEKYLTYRTEGKMDVAAIVFSNVYGILGQTENTGRLLKKYKDEKIDGSR